MEPATFFEGFRCLDCGREAVFGTAVCPDCAGALESVYDDRVLDHQGTEPEPPTVLPPARRLDIGAAGTPMLRLPGPGPGLTDETAARTVLLKLEGQTGTGSIVDRGMGTAVAVAAARGIDRLTLPSTGAGARSAAAYAARADADIDLEAIVPSRTAFANKAMSNAYGADLTVVVGRYTDARTAFEHRTADRGPDNLALARPVRDAVPPRRTAGDCIRARRSAGSRAGRRRRPDGSRHGGGWD